MPMEFESLLSYFNYGIIAIIVFGVIFGFFKGLFKSVYNLIVFVGLLLIGWFLSPLIVRAIINQDISKFGLVISGVQVNSLGQFATDIMAANVDGIQGAMVEGTLLMDLVQASLFMVVRLAFLIIWLILMATVFKFIFWIIYLVIKPKRTKKGVKRKKTLVSRLGGMGVSLAHAFIFILVLSIPLAGLSSIGSSLSKLVPTEDLSGTELSYNEVNLVYTNKGIKLASGDSNEDLEEVIRFLESYRSTTAGKIAGFAKIGDRYFDEIIFDQALSLKTKNGNIRLRYELQIAAGIYGTLVNELDGKELEVENIIELDSEVLDGIIADIAKLKLVHVLIPVGLEVAVLGTMFEEELGDIEQLVDLADLLDKLKKVDYEQEINYLGRAFVAALILMNEAEVNDEEEINFLALDPTKVKDITNNLSNSSILEILSDFALSYIIHMEDAEEFFDEVGLTPADINLTDVTINTELRSLGNIFEALVNAGFTSTNIETLDLGSITDQDINSIGEAVYSSKFFSNNSLILANIFLRSLEDDLRDIFVVNKFDKQDFVSILSLAVIMVKTGMLEDDFNYVNILTEENIDKIADYISKSDLLAENIEGVLGLLLSSMEMPIEIDFPEELTWKGSEGKAELVALFTTAEKVLVMMDDEEGFNFTKEKIDNLADTITESKILMANVDKLLSFIIEEAGIANSFDFVISEDIDWKTEAGKEEFKALLGAVGVILDIGLLDQGYDFANLTDGTVDPNDDQIHDLALGLSESRVIRENLSNLLNQTLSGDFELELLDNPDDWTYQELNSLLSAAKILMTHEDGFSLNAILDLDETEVDIIVTSQIIVNNFVKHLDELTNSGGDLNGIIFLPTGEVDYFGSEGELKKFILASQVVIKENINEGESFSDLDSISLNSIRGENQALILESKIMTETIIRNIEELSSSSDAVKLHPDFDRSQPTYVEGTWEVELPLLLDGISVFFGDDGELDDLDFDIDLFLDLTDEEINAVTASRILSYSAVTYIEDERNNNNSFIALPDVLNPEHGDYNNNLWYGEDGELAKALRSLRELGLSDFEANIDFSNLYAEAKGEVEEVILASLVVEATIIHKIEVEATTGTLQNVLIIPNDIVWEKTYDNNTLVDKGELRRLLVSLELLLDGNTFEDAEFKVEKLFNTPENPNRQETLLESRVVEASIVNTIENEMSTGGSLEGKLVKPANFTIEEWYGEDGELRKFLASIEKIIGPNDFSTAEFDVDTILGDDQEVILDSRVVEASIINRIEEDASSGTLQNVLIIPSDVVWERTYDDNNILLDKGELRRLLVSLDLLLDGNTFENVEFKVEKLFNTPENPNRQETLLESRVVEASIVNTIENEMATGGSLEGKLVKPANFTHDDWYGLDGELRRFLVSIEIIIGPNDFSTAEFDVDTILGGDQELILDSRVVEASVIKFIKDSPKLLIPDTSEVATYYYLSDEEIIWERTFNNGLVVNDGELRKFLAGIKELIGNDSFSTYTFTMDSMLEVNFTNILDSRVLEATIASTVNDLLNTTLQAFIEEPADYGYQWYFHQTGTNEVRRGEFVLTTTSTYQYSDLHGIIVAIQMMDDVGLNFNNINLENIKAADSEDLSDALWNYSRVVRGSIAKLLNETLDQAGIPAFMLRFGDGPGEIPINSQEDVKNGLDAIKLLP